MDEMGSWHVIFNVDPSTQGTWEISGFEKGLPPDMPKVPIWIKQSGDWWSTNQIADSEFLEGIKFLIENDILVLDDDEIKRNQLTQIIIPNGNYVVSGGAVYLPLNLEINPMTTVQWINDDVVQHTVQSQDKFGKIIGLFNSVPLNTGETFEFKFTEEGIYNYYCSLHPWRVGLVTVR